MKSPQIALALITRHLNDPRLVVRFMENASKYSHRVDRVIVACSHSVSISAIEAIRKHVRLDIIRAHDDRSLSERLLAGGMSSQGIEELLEVPSMDAHGEVPYGAYRNAVLFHALLERLDHVIFFDSDVHPRVLMGVEQGTADFREVDFVGTHSSSLSKVGVAATTSDYSGYYIIPPMKFSGLEQLLLGLRKEKSLAYLEGCHRHNCLNLGQSDPVPMTPTHKPIGGNLGLDLREPERLTAFYSTTYVFEGRCIMARGEDTLLGRAISGSDATILDVGLPVFHDTYPGFPRAPDMRLQEIRTRFYRACLGWIGRNPFMTWFLDQAGELQVPFDEAIELQRLGLQIGGVRAAEAFDDSRFADLSQAFQASMADLPIAIHRYRRLMAGWSDFLRAFFPHRTLSHGADRTGKDALSKSQSQGLGGVSPVSNPIA